MMCQLKAVTKKIIILFASFISANIYANTITNCEGRFETGQYVHVRIDWDSKEIYVNKFHTFIGGVTAYGIVTRNYTNKLGIDTFSIIGSYQNAGTFIAQQQQQYGQITFTNFARLDCNPSFYKTFAEKMLDI